MNFELKGTNYAKIERNDYLIKIYTITYETLHWGATTFAIGFKLFSKNAPRKKIWSERYFNFYHSMYIRGFEFNDLFTEDELEENGYDIFSRLDEDNWTRLANKKLERGDVDVNMENFLDYLLEGTETTREKIADYIIEKYEHLAKRNMLDEDNWGLY